ncbi:MAG TPA: sensor domain-containing diguanylate cyclase [Aquihabitans sp.]|nr:sensor domain-containing diguanylate cyclase [Aquihabitans sp.]
MPAFDDQTKGAAFLEGFDDPGPPYDPATGPSDAWYRRVVQESSQVFLALGHDGTIWYVNDAAEVLLGRSVAELIGSNGLDLVAPEDLAEAADTVYHSAEVEGWRPPRPFRLLTSAGERVTFEFEGLALFHAPEVRSVVVIGRHAEADARVDRILDALASHRPLSEVLDELVFMMHRPGWKLGVAIRYDTGEGSLAVAHSGLPAELHELADGGGGPWATASADGDLVVDVGLTTVPDRVREVATAAGYRTCWAVPVADPSGGADACIVVWNGETVPPELGQDKAFRRLRHVLGLALDARAQLAELARAARTDALTGLANRRRYDEHLTDLGEARSITVLFADLDGFKLVNDRLGHAAGDHVIAAVGRRLHGLVRSTDLVARVGGDEFAVVGHDLPAGTATALAERIIAAIGEPVATPAGPATVGVSLGIAIGTDPGASIDAVTAAADAALYAAKAAGRNRYHLHHVDASGGEPSR